MLYIITANGDHDTIQDLAKKAGLRITNPATIRDLIIEDRENDSLLAAVTPEQIMVLARYSTQLLEDAPYVVTSVPGLVETGEWGVHTTAFPKLDYLQFEEMLKKSGHTAFNTSDLQTRSGGEEHNDPSAQIPDDESV